MSTKVSKIVDKQIKDWDRERIMQTAEEQEKVPLPVITISREFGALGAALAKNLGDATGFEVWDKEILGAIAEDLGSDQKLLETLDERRKKDVEDAVSGFISHVHTNVNYIRSLIRVVKTIEEHGSSIIVGRGANYICEKSENLNIRLVRPFNSRVKHISEKNGITVSEARNLVQKMDAERDEFIKRFFYKDMSTPSDYDLIINTETYNLEQIEVMVLHAYEMKTGRKAKALS